MCKSLKIAKCRECSVHAEIAVNEVNGCLLYLIRCPKCGSRTLSFLHVENCIEQWNDKNTPKKVKPKYICGYCKAEIDFGFAVCPKCGAEIDWK